MKLTPQQLREIVGISQETLRHWRQTLPPLQGRKGYSPCFFAADALALLVIREITETLHVKVHALKPIVTRLFEVCRDINWFQLEKKNLVFSFSEPSIKAVDVEKCAYDDCIGPMICLPLWPLITTLRQKLMQEEHSQQMDFPFPPRLVSRQGSGK